MGLATPILLLLAVPVGVLYWWVLRGRERRIPVIVLHALILLLIVLGLAGPYRQRPDENLDLVVVMDRSRSMPEGAEKRMMELLSLIKDQRPPSAKTGIVTFGAEAAVEMLPERGGSFQGPTRPVDPDASNLSAAVETALQIVGTDRTGRILLFTDGQATGRHPRGDAGNAAARNIQIDYRLFRRPDVQDVAVEKIRIPREADVGSSFLVTGMVRADTRTPVRYRLLRNGTPVSSGETVLEAGLQPLSFRDRVPMNPGLHRYALEVVPVGEEGTDAIPENNAAETVLRAVDVPEILLATHHEKPDNLERILSAAGARIKRVPPWEVPESIKGLDPYRVVILEDVPASDIGRKGLQALRRFVVDGGGGLMVTGGRAGFGVGGYYQSEIDEILPVSMELRQEHRKFRMAMAIVLDRSGSMAMTTADGSTKMDLANRGAAEAIRLLGPMDEVSVIAVDSASHIMVPLTRNDTTDDIIGRTLSIQSMGGGIYVYTGLASAGKQLAGASAASRHVVLFADAADAEEPGDYKNLLEKFLASGITVSVIGLGSESDPDAAFLKDVAKRGNGRVFFTDAAEDLPRIFAQETLQAARSAFIEEPVSAAWKPDIRLIGEVGRRPFPTIGGYNLSYRRPEAAVGLVTADDNAAPLLSFWHRGTGRVVAYTGEVDGPATGNLRTWEGTPDFFVELMRWLVGPGEPDGVSLDVGVDEPEVCLTFEFDPDSDIGRAVPASPPTLTLLSEKGKEGDRQIPFEWTGEHRLQARFSLKRNGIHLPMVRLPDGQVLRAPPLTLPYSPEFLPEKRKRAEETLSGEPLLKDLARLTGGKARTSMDDIFDTAGLTRQRRSLRPLLALILLVLIFGEVMARRLQLWELLPTCKCGKAPVTPPAAAEPASAPPASAPAPTSSATDKKPAPAAAPEPPPISKLDDALSRAKRSAKKRLN